MGNRHWRVSLALLILACEPPLPRPPEPTPDTGCSSACSRLIELACPEGEPTPGGVACEDVCSVAGGTDYASGWPTACIARAVSCDAARMCSEPLP